MDISHFNIMSIPSVKKLAFLLGATSVISQIILLREIFTTFSGNEISYAIVLACWLFWISIGSFSASSLLQIVNRPKIWISILMALTYIVLPGTILFVRAAKSLIGIEVGTVVGLLPICSVSFILLAPLTLMLGSMFVFICRVSRQSEENSYQGTAHIGKLYLWESLGAAVGGLLYGILFIHFIPHLNMAFLLGIVNVLSILLVFRDNRIIKTLILLFVAMVILFASDRTINNLERWSYQSQWKGWEVIESKNTIYGNVTLCRYGNDYNVYHNGTLNYSSKDDYSAEERTQFPVLEYPKELLIYSLLIGRGLSGEIGELNKYSSRKIFYVDVDPGMIHFYFEYLPEELIASLYIPALAYAMPDPRLYVKQSDNKFGIVINNVSNPTSLLTNRYFTLEFFQDIARILEDEGIFAINVSSSENYINKETREYLRSIHTTLRQVFKDVKVIPGNTSVFLAAKQPGILHRDPALMIEKLKKLGIENKLVNEYYLPFRLSKDRVDYIDEVLLEDGIINTDRKPVTHLFNITLWLTQFDANYNKLFSALEKLQLKHLLAIPIFVLVLGIVLLRKCEGVGITLSIMTTGFSEIVFQIIVVFMFQVLYGYAYYMICFIISSFMIGLALGSFMANKMLQKSFNRILSYYRVLQLCICLYPLLLGYIFNIFHKTKVIHNYPAFFAFVFASLPIIAGFIGGAQYPLALQLKKEQKRGMVQSKQLVAKTAGFLYGVDVFGAALGALITSTILIPFLGIDAVITFCASINLSVLVLLLLSKSSKSTS